MNYNIDIANINTYPSDLLNAINSNTHDNVWKSVSKYSLICYHYTRLISKDEIENNRIKQLNFMNVINRVESEYRLNFKNLDNLYLFVEDLKNSVKDFDVRDRRISFIAGYNKKQIDEYSYYAESFGGEYVEMISRKYTNINDNLKKLGKPYIIKFIIPFTIIKIQKGNLYERVIKCMIDNVKNNYDNCVELYTFNYDVPKENIIFVKSI